MAARRSFRHINDRDRYTIELRVKDGRTPQEIADELGFHVSTIYRELERGRYKRLNSDYTERESYSPEISKARAAEAATAKGAPLKIGHNYAVVEYIEGMILEKKYSPAAICAELRKPENLEKYNITFCRVTLYKYIDDGNIFPNVTRKNLRERGERKNDHKEIKEKKAPRGRSIEERPAEVESREVFGHWEMDTVVGRTASKARLLVLSERKTRYEIIIRMADGTTASVVRALNRLERQYGASFSEIFKTITVDNGSEFADCEGIEKSCRRSGSRTTLYYCHPYTSCERGTNENINRMIRWHFPKGTSFDDVTAREVAEVAVWINDYPREILDFASAEMLFTAELSLAA